MSDRLSALGFPVTVLDDGVLTAAAVAGSVLVVFSGTGTSARLGVLAGSPVPVATWENAGCDDLGITAAAGTKVAGAEVDVVATDPMPADAVVDISDIGTARLTVRANVSPSVVGSLRWALDGVPSFRLENSAPYALAGDWSGDFAPWALAPGQHTVGATPYSEANATGESGTPATVTFTLQP